MRRSCPVHVRYFHPHRRDRRDTPVHADVKRKGKKKAQRAGHPSMRLCPAPAVDRRDSPTVPQQERGLLGSGLPPERSPHRAGEGRRFDPAVRLVTTPVGAVPGACNSSGCRGWDVTRALPSAPGAVPLWHWHATTRAVLMVFSSWPPLRAAAKAYQARLEAQQNLGWAERASDVRPVLLVYRPINNVRAVSRPSAPPQVPHTALANGESAARARRGRRRTQVGPPSPSTNAVRRTGASSLSCVET